MQVNCFFLIPFPLHRATGDWDICRGRLKTRETTKNGTAPWAWAYTQYMYVSFRYSSPSILFGTSCHSALDIGFLRVFNVSFVVVFPADHAVNLVTVWQFVLL